ncbi:MAG: FAD-dependent oxidoreductase [Pseudomonadota bacterium]|jgi:NAD(P)H-nitrite reductase large subunit
MAPANKPKHHVVVGSGVAGSQAAATLRERDPDSRITIFTLSSLPFYNRYDLPKVFRGRQDWREFLVYPPSYYEEHRITLRRNCRVANVDGRRRVLALEHKEDVAFDTLLVASGGRAYLPEELSDFRLLMQRFASFTEAMGVRKQLPEGGHAVLLGGDMIGLDLARTLVDTGYRVSLVTGPHTFWPHEVSDAQRPVLLAALERMGVVLVDGVAAGGIAAIEEGARGMPARRVVFRDGSDLRGDVVMPFFGLVPSVEFMLGSGVDIERGLLVNEALRTTDEAIYAAGDVCQIWSDAERKYRFYYGWKNVRAMGELAARNMTGGDEPFRPAQDEQLEIRSDGWLHSPFWEYE